MRFRDMPDSGVCLAVGFRYAVPMVAHRGNVAYLRFVRHFVNLRGWHQSRFAGWRPWEQWRWEEVEHG